MIFFLYDIRKSIQPLIILEKGTRRKSKTPPMDKGKKEREGEGVVPKKGGGNERRQKV